MKILKLIGVIYVTICTVMATWLLLMWVVNGGYIGMNGKKVHYEGVLKTSKLDTLDSKK